MTARLATLQRQFYDRVTAGAPPDDPDDDPDDDPSDDPPEDPGDRLIASGDLEVYAGMYASRLRDTLADDYPKLRAALGAEPFADVATRYLRERPPRSFTLRDAGIELADWLRPSELAPPWAADLAALERARIEVFDGPDAQPLTQADVIAQGAGLPELALSWIPSSVVVPLAWAVDDLWSAIEDDQPMFEPVRDDRVVLVWRRDISVLHRTLDADEAQLALQIIAGVRFADVCEVLGGIHGEAAGQRAAALLLRWLEAEALVAPAG
jgi:hypothetical protein